jgi:hypothetical protein
MKLELEISDELWKRIEHSANVFHKPIDAYLRELLEERVLRIPDPEGAAKLLDEIRASCGPEDDYDIDEFIAELEKNRGPRFIHLLVPTAHWRDISPT